MKTKANADDAELDRFQQQGYLLLVSSGPIVHLPRKEQMAGDRLALIE